MEVHLTVCTKNSHNKCQNLTYSFYMFQNPTILNLTFNYRFPKRFHSFGLVVGFALACTFPLLKGSLLLSDILEMESGLEGGEESTSTGSSSFTLTSEGVCKLISSAPELRTGNYMEKKER